MGHVARLLDTGSIRAVIDSTYALRDINKAIAFQRKGRAAGKVVIVVSSSSSDNERNGEVSTKTDDDRDD